MGEVIHVLDFVDYVMARFTNFRLPGDLAGEIDRPDLGARHALADRGDGCARAQLRGGSADHGPKIDIAARPGREWQGPDGSGRLQHAGVASTSIHVGLDGAEHRVVMIHRGALARWSASSAG